MQLLTPLIVPIHHHQSGFTNERELTGKVMRSVIEQVVLILNETIEFIEEYARFEEGKFGAPKVGVSSPRWLNCVVHRITII